jgi:hypothetical protein
MAHLLAKVSAILTTKTAVDADKPSNCLKKSSVCGPKVQKSQKFGEQQWGH